MDKIQIVDTLISENRLEDALRLLNETIAESSDSDDLYFRRGKLRWRLGDRSGAMGDYAQASELNPASPAVKALEQAYDVANFFNPDLYNP